MKKYEFALVLQESTGKDETKANKLVADLVSQVKGKIIETKVMGIRPLAYPINKQTSGWYAFYVVSVPEEEITQLNQLAEIDEKILRYLIVRAPREIEKRDK
jgi:small subunit ribosomal protein S6